MPLIPKQQHPLKGMWIPSPKKTRVRDRVAVYSSYQHLICLLYIHVFVAVIVMSDIQTIHWEHFQI